MEGRKSACALGEYGGRGVRGEDFVLGHREVSGCGGGCGGAGDEGDGEEGEWARESAVASVSLVAAVVVVTEVRCGGGEGE